MALQDCSFLQEKGGWGVEGANDKRKFYQHKTVLLMSFDERFADNKPLLHNLILWNIVNVKIA